jgi:hypothetical protein
MTILDWTLSVMLFTIYIVCLFTVCMLTLKKGYIVLGIIGIIFPFLWLIGAILPAKVGSQYQMEEAVRMQQHIGEMTG